MKRNLVGRKLESDLKFLCQRAKELGASDAIAIPASAIVVDDRVRLKCMVPLCPCYNKNLVCPPNVMPISEFKRTLRYYHSAILLREEAAPYEPPEELTQYNNLSEMWEIVSSVRNGRKNSETTGDDYIRCLNKSQEKLLEVISQIESLCIARGYLFAAGLGAGTCTLCEECVGVASRLTCRHPFKARPPMEALGIDVLATAKNARMQVNFTPNGIRNWVGLVLVD